MQSQAKTKTVQVIQVEMDADEASYLAEALRQVKNLVRGKEATAAVYNLQRELDRFI